MILAGHHADAEEIERFQTEARAAARLDHPGIVPVYEIGEYQNQHFFTMAYIEGESLADKVRDTTLPPRQAAEILKKIAHAMAHAHSHDVIHRDLKPSNVLMDIAGQPKVTDFGLARTLEKDSGLTQTGAVMGTPGYMAPEQALGLTNEIGPHSDVYALGGILYRLLAGRPPFQSSNVLETIRQVAETDPISPRILNPEVDDDLETICMKCLEKDIQQRPESAEFLAEELGRYLAGIPVFSRKPSRWERLQKWCMRNRAESAVIVMAVLIIALGAVLFAVTVLPKVVRYLGNDFAMNSMFVCALAGPAVTITRKFGLSDARPTETMLMNLGKNCLCFGYAMVTGFASFLSVLVFVVVLNSILRAIEDSPEVGSFILLLLLAASWGLGKSKMRGKLLWIWGSLFCWVLSEVLGLIWPVFDLVAVVCLLMCGVLLGTAIVHGKMRLLYWPAHRYAIAVKQTFGWVPWPVSLVSGRFQIRNVVWLANLFPLVILFGVVQLLLSMVIVAVAIPIWAFEQLRLILFPQSQILTESVGYVISAAASMSLLVMWVL